MLETSTNNIKNDLKSLGNDASNLFNDVGTAVTEKAGEIRNRSKIVMGDTLTRAKEIRTSAVEGSKKLARNTDDYVHHHPWRAIAVSAGAGLLLGYLLQKRD